MGQHSLVHSNVPYTYYTCDLGMNWKWHAWKWKRSLKSSSHKIAFILGYYIRFDSSRRLKIAAKGGIIFDYYRITEGWIEGQWTHMAFTWAAGKGIRAYLNGCDMDADDSRGYAYDKRRRFPVSKSLSFRLGKSRQGKSAAVGVAIDELCIWHEELDPQQIWQFYIQGGTVRSGWCYITILKMMISMAWTID